MYVCMYVLYIHTNTINTYIDQLCYVKENSLEIPLHTTKSFSIKITES